MKLYVSVGDINLGLRGSADRIERCARAAMFLILNPDHEEHATSDDGTNKRTFDGAIKDMRDFAARIVNDVEEAVERLDRLHANRLP